MQRLGWLSLLLISVFFASVLYAAAPTSFRYQGTLKENEKVVDGTKTMRFRFTNSDGSTQYWTSGNVAVTVTGGVFSTELTPSVDWNNIPGGGYYLEISVEGEVLLPREKVLSNIYSLHARNIDDGIVTQAKLDTGVAAQLNLGTHIATTTLNMSNQQISNVGAFHYPVGHTAGDVLTVDAAGNASWGNPGVVAGTGDSLGSHIATMTLNMANFAIINSSGFQMTTGASSGYVLTSDGAGYASWAAPTGDSLGTHVATQTLNMSGFGISNAASFQMTTGASAGYILSSDGSGNAAWISTSTFAGDNFGNHVATTTVNMSNNDIINVKDVKSSTTSVFYLGDENTDGTWRFQVDGNGDLIFEKRIGGSYVTQTTIDAP
ncbi:hypothetical protein ACFL58_00865 [Elusimicrobiota bacterium]